MKIKLKNCPFCGSTELYIEYGAMLNSEFYIWCANCDTETGMYDSLEELEMTWNSRVDNGCVREIEIEKSEERDEYLGDFVSHRG